MVLRDERITAEVILDSIAPNMERITTFSLCFPRIILSEFNTHRVFSRNARSTRAVPTSKLIKEVRGNPYIPARMYKNKPGMQGTELIVGEERERLVEMWRKSAESAAYYAEYLFDLDLHKQHAGRVVEPYTYTFVCLTTTEIENFLNLRDDDAAQPEIQDLAVAIRAALEASEPQLLEYGQWHLPYLRGEDMKLRLSDQLKISTARCARVSYKNFEGRISTQEEDLALAKKLTEGKPHLSPFEHQGCASNYSDYNYRQFRGNFTGFKQYRKFIETGY